MVDSDSNSDNHDAFDYTDICNIKQGYLAELTPDAYNVKQKNGNLIKTLHASDTFIVINGKSISLFENSNV